MALRYVALIPSTVSPGTIVEEGHQIPMTTRDRGRPRTYNGPTLPVSFRVPASWRVLGSAKARGRVNLTKLFAMYYRDFLDMTIEDTQAFMARWEEVHGSTANMEDDP